MKFPGSLITALYGVHSLGTYQRNEPILCYSLVERGILDKVQDYKMMSPVCVLDGKYEPRVDGRLENITQIV